MASEEHQKLLNSLANAMESEGIAITHIDIDETPDLFDDRFRKLPKPKERDGHIPDIEGMKGALRHIGEVKISITADPSFDSQLKSFTNREMNGKEIPLHLAVPAKLKKDLEKKLYKMGLYTKYKKGTIRIWA